MTHIVKRPQCNACKGRQFERIYATEPPVVDYVDPVEFLESENEPVVLESITDRKCYLVCNKCGAKYELDASMPDLETPDAQNPEGR